MFSIYIMDYKYKYLKYYKKYLNLINSNFEQTHGGSGEFNNTTRLFIMYQGIGEQNKKALIERKRILLDDPELHFNDPKKGGHVTLLDITFNSEHTLFGNIIANQDTLAGQIRTAFDNNLHFSIMIKLINIINCQF